ncbi:hypothetical protein P3T76_002235 [Phytophthora citrophthora]|uniref:Uncharacterized protein n=1 Tax=Phytophthora citrophthora TaxID=4793 RepID=A0AAD9GZ05_9STRA|nr:hypothetical protein P3T76_002235 [Phytophthora citrophthora]
MNLQSDLLPVYPFGLKTPSETGLGIRETVARVMNAKRSLFIDQEIKDINDIPAMTQEEEDELLTRITPPSDQFIEVGRGLFKIERITGGSNNFDTKYSITYATESPRLKL